MRLHALALALAAAPALAPIPLAAQGDSTRAPLPVVGRSMVITKYGIVAASQPLAASAGVEMLERGGNAVDAALAASAAIGLMEPAMNGIGGDMFAMVYEARTGKLHGLNSSGWAATGMSPAFLASKGITGRMPRRGIYAITVPGLVAGWDALRSRFGTLDFATLLAPTIRYADEGFPVTEVIAHTWGEAASLLAETPSAASTFLIAGHAPREGEIFRNPNLARTLRRIAAKGRDGFYRGETAAAILALERAQGGTMTAADLADYQPEWVSPVSTTYHGWTVYEMPPNSQGVAALMMLDIMERFPIAEWGFLSPRTMHAEIEAKKLAYADMLRYVADPRTSRIPVDVLLSRSRMATRAALVDPAHANCDVPPDELRSVSDAHGGDTIYLTVVDRDGNIVSLIQSLYSAFGSGLVPEGMGFALHNRGSLFSLEPDRPNTLAAHHRPLHTIIPGFMEKDGVRIGFGIMGGWNQSQAHAQFVSNIADFGMSIQQALEAPRFTKDSFGGCDVSIETLVPAATRQALAALGHEVRAVAPRSGTFGWGQAVMSRPDGVHFGASEPRHDGAAIPQAIPQAVPPGPSGRR